MMPDMLKFLRLILRHLKPKKAESFTVRDYAERFARASERIPLPQSEMRRVAVEIIRCTDLAGGELPKEWLVDREVYDNIVREWDEGVKNGSLLSADLLPNGQMHLVGVPIRIRDIE